MPNYLSRMFVIFAFYLLLVGACCRPERLQPSLPGEVLGWQEVYPVKGLQVVAILVLKKGESSDNGKIGIQVVDVIAPERCSHAGTYQGEPKSILRFFDPTSGQTLCEATVLEGGSTLHCDSRVGLTGIYVNAINTKDNWVWLDLRKPANDKDGTDSPIDQ